MKNSISPVVRRNSIGIQMLSPGLHKQLFPQSLLEAPSDHIKLAQKHLETHQLWGKTSKDIHNVEFELPKLLGCDISEHFQVLGTEQQNDYSDHAEELATCAIPQQPKVWSKREGWTRYSIDGTPASIPCPPLEESLVLDVEVLYKLSPYPIMATACSAKAWYSWVMPGFFDDEPKMPNELIPLSHSDRKRLVVGHFVAFDRARIMEEYFIESSGLGFIDTLSLHSAISGLSSQQRLSWMKYQKGKKVQPSNDVLSSEQKDFLAFQQESSNFSNGGEFGSKSWEELGSTNSLEKVAELHLKKQIDKSQRIEFDTIDISSLSEPEKFQELMKYCAADVSTTFELFQVLYPKFKQKCPHPVSFAGMMHMSKSFLTTNQSWNSYITTCERMSEEYISKIEEKLKMLADDALKYLDDGSFKNDPWLSKLDWTVKPVNMTKEKVSKRGIVKPSRPYASSNLELQGKPRWYRELWDLKLKKFRISASKKVVPYLLRLEWNQYPVFYNAKFGWMYHGPADSIRSRTEVTAVEPENAISGHLYYRIPHPSGDEKNCGNPLAKSFIKAFESKVLTSSFPEAQDLLKMNSYCIYWISARARIKSQFVVWDKKSSADNHHDTIGVIIPQTAVMGTVTRRATDATWMTAPNAKKNRIGSELKSKIVAPPGYKILGADVDSEELWIASLIGDSQFGIHGASAIGFMTLQGTKGAGTDLHSTSGRIVGISRDIAKIFNYSRIYGAGQNYAAKLLLQHNPGLDKKVAIKKATDLYAQTKGSKIRDYKRIFGSDHIWYGGSESFMFNRLEAIASSADTRTPILECQIPDTLCVNNVNGMFKTSRINWVVQSSGVDYLHLLLVSMDYLMRRMKIDGRFLLSIHDEVRYLIREEDAEKAALALQISNLWTRCLFASKLGMHDLPLNVAFFSAVDIDNVLRKEVDMSCVTPSNPTPIPPGNSLGIAEILELIKNPTSIYGTELKSIEEVRLNTEDLEQKPYLSELSSPAYIKAQMAGSAEELKAIIAKHEFSKLAKNAHKFGTFSIV